MKPIFYLIPIFGLLALCAYCIVWLWWKDHQCDKAERDARALNR